jgi:hypothetical protein
MNNFWARFEEIDENIYRYDTRIYIKPVNNIQDSDICLGAVVGKNPGSAKGEVCVDLKEINLDGDKLLPTVRNIFIKSYKLANIELPERAYIQVLNLFYLCEADLNLAINEAKDKTIKGICKTEKKKFPFVWFVWGGDDKFLNIYKNRFESINAGQFFYYDNQEGVIIQKIPTDKSSAKHTQGLTHSYVVPHISNILKAIQT